jgi:hypothetical protein
MTIGNEPASALRSRFDQNDERFIEARAILLLADDNRKRNRIEICYEPVTD